MFLDNLRIRTKALIPVVVLAIAVLTNVVVGSYKLSWFNTAAQDVIDRRDQGLASLLKATRTGNLLKITVFQSLMYADDAGASQAVSENEIEKKILRRLAPRTDDLIAEAAGLLPDHAAELAGLSKQFDAIAERAKSPFKIGQDTPGLGTGHSLKPEELDSMAEGSRQLHEVDKASSSLNDGLTALSDKVGAENKAIAGELEAKGRSGIFWLASVGFAATLFAVVLSIWIMSRKIALPLSQLSDRMGQLAGGNLETEIENRGRRDEVGQMASAVQVFKDHAIERVRIEAEAKEAARRYEAEQAAALAERERASAEQSQAMQRIGDAVSNLADKNLAYRVTERLAESYEPLRADLNSALEQLERAFASVEQSAKAVGSGTQEIAVAANDLSKRTEQQASSLEESSAALNEITSRVTKTADGARSASASVTTARQVSEKGMEIVRNAADAMKRIEELSRKIGEIIGVIDEIAFQTNLLALERRGRSGARRRLRPRIRGGGRRSARPGAAGGGSRQGDQGP